MILWPPLCLPLLTDSLLPASPLVKNPLAGMAAPCIGLMKDDVTEGGCDSRSSPAGSQPSIIETDVNGVKYPCEGVWMSERGMRGIDDIYR